MHFSSDGRFQIFIGEVDAGTGTYEIDYSISPAYLVLYYDVGFTILTIVEFPDYDTMWMANSYIDEPRPMGFSDFAILPRFNP